MINQNKSSQKSFFYLTHINENKNVQTNGSLFRTYIEMNRLNK